MKRITTMVTASLFILLLISGCNSSEQTQNQTQTQNKNNQSTQSTPTVTVPLNSDGSISSIDVVTQFTNNDYNTANIFSNTYNISLSDGNSTADSDSIIIENDIITIKNEGSYYISGTLANGQIVIDSDSSTKIQLILDNADISNNSSAPIYVKLADKVFITTTKSSNNVLSANIIEDASAETNIDSAIFSKEDLTLNGLGSLTVVAVNGNGITSKDDLVISSGNYSITSDKHGLEANNSVRIADGVLNIASQKDGIHSDHEEATLGYIYIENGTFDINSQGDGIDSSSSVKIADGIFNITVGGGNTIYTQSMNNSSNLNFTAVNTQNSTSTDDTSTSSKAIKSNILVEINNGTFDINAYDDAIHSDYQLDIFNGTFNISTGDDAIHADVYINIYDGNINISSCREGIEAQIVSISGGNIDVYSNEDGINSTMSSVIDAPSSPLIDISGGHIVLNVNYEGDGLDSNGSINISGGEIYIHGTTDERDTPLDFDNTGIITGGTFISAGSSSRTSQNFSTSSTQCSIFVQLANSQTGSIILKDSSNNIVASFDPLKPYQTAVISTPDIKIGETYTLVTGDTSQSITMESYIYGSSTNSSNKQRK